MRWVELIPFLLLIFIFEASCFSRFPQGKGADNKPKQSVSPENSVNGKCFYNGTSYDYGEKIPTTEKCLICVCNEEFNQKDISACERMECPHDHFKHLYSSCIPLYEKDECCPIRWDCGKGLSKIDSQCKCNLKYLRHYEAKNCTPIYEIEGCACPTRFECQPAKELDPAVCRYKGKVYQVGTEIETGAPCERCRCHRHAGQERATFDCLNIECSAFNSPIGEGCYRSHNLSYCCSVDTICPSKDEEVPTCEYDGKLYNLGQKIYPEKEPCITCLCTKDWSGIYSNNCVRNKCFMGQYGNLERGCIPIYHEEACCHVEFHCPEERDQAKGVQKAALDKGIPEKCVLPMEKGPCFANFQHYFFNILTRKCESFRYGGCLGNENNFLTLEECQSTCEAKLRTTYTNLDHMCYFDGHYYRIGEEYGINHPTGCVTCTCNVPPELTCIYKACPSPPHDYGVCNGVYTPGVCCPQYNCTTTAGEQVSWSYNIQSEIACDAPKCPPGCEIIQDSSPGVCPGCRCHIITTDSSIAEECPEVTCPSPFCMKYTSTDGCPQCICDLICPTLKCPPGCEPEDNAEPGRCPGCSCGDSQNLVTSWNSTGKQSGSQSGSSYRQSSYQFQSSSKTTSYQTGSSSSSSKSGFQEGLSKQSVFQKELTSKESSFQGGSTLGDFSDKESSMSSKQLGFQSGSSSKEPGFQSESTSKQTTFQRGSLSKQPGFENGSSFGDFSDKESSMSTKQLGFQSGSSSKEPGFQSESISKQTTFQRESLSKQPGFESGSSSKALGSQSASSSQQSGSQRGSTSQQSGSQRGSISKQPGLQEGSSKKPDFQKGPKEKRPDFQRGVASKPYGLNMEYSSLKRPDLNQKPGLQMESSSKETSREDKSSAKETSGKSESSSEQFSSKMESSVESSKKCFSARKCEYPCQIKENKSGGCPQCVCPGPCT